MKKEVSSSKYKIFNYLIFLIFILIINSACLPKSKDTIIKSRKNNSNKQINFQNNFQKIINSTFAKPLKKLTSRNDILSIKKGRTFYLDAINGHDTHGNGSKNKPWRTLDNAAKRIKGGDLLFLRKGNYGSFRYSKTNRRWIILMNYRGERPVISNIKIRKNLKYSTINARLIFFGIKISPKWVNPGADPQFASSNLKTYKKTVRPVDIYNASNIKFIKCEVSGTNKHLTPSGFYITNSKNIIIERCHIYRLNRAITFVNTTNLKIYYNYLHETTSSLIVDGSAGSSSIIIEGNHGHDINWNIQEDYCPRAKGKTYHASFVALRNPNVIIRKNIFHDGGNSSGIMFYTDRGQTFSNILIENNLIYDPHSSNLIRLNNLGTNVTIRNNTFIGRGRKTTFGGMKYTMALGINSVAFGYNGSGVFLYNNIFIGNVNFGGWKVTINEGNNIYWAAINRQWKFYSNHDFKANSKVITKGGANSDYFENGFFSGEFTASWPEMNSGNVDALLNPSGHGKILDLTLSNNSKGINFGDPAKQPSGSLGSLVNGFIQIDGVARGTNRHSAGCYEKN